MYEILILRFPDPPWKGLRHIRVYILLPSTGLWHIFVFCYSSVKKTSAYSCLHSSSLHRPSIHSCVLLVVSPLLYIHPDPCISPSPGSKNATLPSPSRFQLIQQGRLLRHPAMSPPNHECWLFHFLNLHYSQIYSDAGSLLCNLGKDAHTLHKCSLL